LLDSTFFKRGLDYGRVISMVDKMVRLGISGGAEVQFALEGYSRQGSNFEFIADIIRSAVSAGATTICCPDTVGGACKLQGDAYFVNHMIRHAELVRKEFPNQEITWSIHCHNDLGLALENTMNGVFLGPARQIEVCMNGVGERAGNAALEQCALYLSQFGRLDASGRELFSEIKLEKLQSVSDFVSQEMLPRQSHWPITGENAMLHTSGAHSSGTLRNTLAYQPFDPAVMGKAITMVFGPLSGGSHAQEIIRQNGFECDDSEKSMIAQFIKDYFADRRKGITEAEVVEGFLEYRRAKERNRSTG
jgi:2-isopropylmalate synthase